jgi:hypothetical protein
VKASHTLGGVGEPEMEVNRWLSFFLFKSFFPFFLLFGLGFRVVAEGLSIVAEGLMPEA